LNSYIKYAGLAFQMLVIIGGMTYLGNYLDNKWQFNTPWMTICLALLGVTAAMYQVIKSVNKP
jgi:F0F1-type ATP synthase assembly protein I